MLEEVLHAGKRKMPQTIMPPRVLKVHLSRMDEPSFTHIVAASHK